MGKIMPMLHLAGVVATSLVATGTGRDPTLLTIVVEADQIMVLGEESRVVVEEVMLVGLVIIETNVQVKLVHATT
jgi:hypothetical protein